jgi:hypothetical protein
VAGGELPAGKKNYIQFICGSVYSFQIHAIFQYLFLRMAQLKRRVFLRPGAI